MTDEQKKERVLFAAYISNYITEEINRNKDVAIDYWMVLDAMDAYEGGAGEEE
jgi:hypothetical protein